MMAPWVGMADLRFAVRTLRRSPVFALGAVLTLALGIGANVAVFTFVKGLLLQPLPYPEPDRLVAVEDASRFRDALDFVRPALRPWICMVSP